MVYTRDTVMEFRELVKAALVAVWKFEVEKDHAVAVVTAQRRAAAQVRCSMATLNPHTLAHDKH